MFPLKPLDGRSIFMNLVYMELNSNIDWIDKWLDVCAGYKEARGFINGYIASGSRPSLLNS